MIKNLQTICNFISYEVYEIGDMANPHELNGAISSINEAKNYFASYDFSKKYDLDTVADYYLVKKLIDLKKLSPYATDEYKEKIKLLDFYDGILKQFNEQQIAEFYNSFDFDIPDGYYGLIFVMYADLPKWLNKGVTEDAYEKAFVAHPYLIMSHYSAYNNVLSKYKKLYAALFSDENLKIFKNGLDSHFAEIAKKICKDKNFFDPTLKKKILQVFIDWADKIVSNTDKQNALHYQILYKEILEFFKDIAFAEYDKYKEAQKAVDNLSNEWLSESGQQISYEIPLKDVLVFFNNEKIDPAEKQLFLTHYKSEGELSHFCVPAMKKKNSPLLDFVSSPQDHNEHFTFSVLHSIAMAHQIYVAIFQIYLADDKYRNNYIELKNSFVEYILEALNMSMKPFKSQIALLDNKIENYIKLWKIKDPSLEDKEMAKDCGWKAMQFIETFLREIYVAIKREKKEFCDREKLTLGNALDYHDRKNPFNDIFPIQFMQYLNYMLATDVDDKGKRVGYNMRNNVAHTNQNIDDYNIVDTLMCIMIMTGIINSLFLYYNKIVVERSEKERARKKRIAEIDKKQNEALEQLQKLQDEVNELRQQLSDAQTHIMQGIVYPEAVKEFASRHIDITQLKESDVDKLAELKDFIIQYIKENLEGTEAYQKYKQILAKSDQKEWEFSLLFLKFYLEAEEERKEIFSKEYSAAIEELAKEGMFLYCMRLPDIPETLLLEDDKSKRREHLAELYSLQLKKIYGKYLEQDDSWARAISEVIDDIDNEQFDVSYLKLISMIAPLVEDLQEVYARFRENEGSEAVQFVVNGKPQNLQYYTSAIDRMLDYWGKIKQSMDGEEDAHYSKADCVGLLWMMNNIRELSSIISAANTLIKMYKVTQ